jgi:hypothetical protein
VAAEKQRYQVNLKWKKCHPIFGLKRDIIWLAAQVSLSSGITVGSKIAVATDPSNKIVVFAKRSTNNYLYCLYQIKTDSFSTWSPLGGNVALGDQIVVGSQEAFGGAGKLQVFANKLSHDTVLTLYQTAAGASGAWLASYVKLGSNAANGLCVGKNADGKLQVFATTSAGSQPNTGVIATCYQQSSTGWSGWQNLPSSLTIYAGSNMTVGKNTDGRLELFFWGMGFLDHMWQNSSNGYFSWSYAGNNIGPGASGSSNFIGVINNTAASSNLSLFIFNDNQGINCVGTTYVDWNQGGWLPFDWFSNL